MIKLISLILSILAILEIDLTLGVCWDTGCQLDSWKDKGCAQYQMVETGRSPCPNGKIYSCCSGSAPAPAPPPSSGDGKKYGDATYYNLGMTACGQSYTDQDMVAAIAFSYFTAPNPNMDKMCGRKVRVTDASSPFKSVVVTIRDKCGGCKDGDIDLSPAAFGQIRDFGVGRFKVNWEFI